MALYLTDVQVVKPPAAPTERSSSGLQRAFWGTHWARTMEPNPMVAKPSRRRRRATTGDLSAIFEEAKIGSYDAGDASADVKPRRQLSVKAEPGPRRSVSLGPSQFEERSKPRARRATFDSFGAPGNSFGAADSPRRSLSQRPEGSGWAANGEPPKRTSSRRSST